MHYEQSIEVTASADVIWSVLMDVTKWPEWTASIRTITPLGAEPLAVGSRVRISQPKLPTAVWEVTELVPGRSFTWVSRNPGMTSTAVHSIAPGPVSRVTLRIEQTGPASLVARLFLPLTRKYVQMEAAGLKARCESGE